MAICFEACEEFVQQDHFAAVNDQAFQCCIAVFGSCLGALKQIWMICSFLQLHRDVEQRDLGVARCQCGIVLRIMYKLQLDNNVAKGDLLVTECSYTTKPAFATSQPARYARSLLANS